MFRLMALALTLSLLACGSGDREPAALKKTQTTVDWRLLVQLPDVELPVRLHLAEDGSEAWLINGSEKVEISDISREGDGWRLYLPAFNNTLVLRQADGILEGSLTLVKRGYEQVMPVRGEPYPGYRFTPNPEPLSDFTGRWEVTFVTDEGKETASIGEFDQQGGKVTGTFLNATGDYRFLAGEVHADKMYLSTMDGAHAFVFTATMLADGSLKGDFWSGTRWHESWTAKRNFKASLPDAFSLTYPKQGYDRIEFSFPDLQGQPLALADDKFRDKVVLVTLSGSWCPNCADEMEFLADYYRANRDRGLEIITLLYEHFEEFEAAAQQGRALKAKHGVDYDILVAGISDKTMAAETLPMLNKVLAFPTMIFIDRKGDVRRIHTGFSGPGTGRHYQEFVEEFNALMETLLTESWGP